MKKRITEQSLYPEISKLLKANGFDNISAIGIRHGYFDFECFYNSKRFIAEIKIGTGRYLKNLLRGITQAWGYCQKVKGDGILVIEYPAQIRTPLFIKPEIVRHLTTESKVNAIFLSDFFNESFSSVKASELFPRLKFSIDEFLATKETKTSFKLVIETLRTGIGIISEILRAQRTKKEISELIDIVVGRFDLFLGLGQIEKTKKAIENLQLAAIDLIPYLLSNQILFYRVFSETTGKIEKLDEGKITSIESLRGYFKKITDINYKAIYSVDLASRLPNQKEIVAEVREIIKAINILKPEFVSHDLLGRLYHELLPPTTRKVLAAFYTNPIAADILAGLTIDKWDNTVIDPACGSGTLLVAAYKRKFNLYKQKKQDNSSLQLKNLHKKFVEEQITGIDIMPFASHLTAVNLAAQNPNAITNKVRVGCQDSLELQSRLSSPEFTKEGIPIEPFQTLAQFTIFGKEKVLERAGAVGLEGGKGEKFILKPLDIVLMNPPFSDRHKMPKEYKEHLKDFQHLIKICGNQINFWGFFLALADYLLKEKGRMGLVIPINIARGEATQQIRDYILKNYYTQYILKTTREIAFSEGAAFRDILFITQKRKPKPKDLTGIIFLKKSIRDLSDIDARNLIKEIKSINPKAGYQYSCEEFEIEFIEHKKLLENKYNLMYFLAFSALKRKRVIDNFLAQCKQFKDKMIKIEKDWLQYGFPDYPAGLSQIVFLIRPSDKSREKRAFLLLREENNNISFQIKSIPKFRYRIDKNKTVPALKTITGIKSISLNEKHDYLIQSDFKDSDSIIKFSNWNKKRKFDWNFVKDKSEHTKTNLAIPRRFNLYSDNTHLLAVYSDTKFVPTNKFLIFKIDNPKKSKILSLYLNSILYLVQLFLNKSETTGQLIEIMQPDLALIDVINVDRLSENERKSLLKTFDKITNVEFPSIIEQLEKRFPARVELDKNILQTLGFSDAQIEEWLPKVYDALVEELKATKEMR
ncbi:N-6 DNA methylase [Patescibacteria group bacterium]|nr:N-6 DNA methylase [Patescibacteria group bacterium]MBZ9578225.1 N-6 DNA methylase [Patescibacteria group bacterium]